MGKRSPREGKRGVPGGALPDSAQSSVHPALFLHPFSSNTSTQVSVHGGRRLGFHANHGHQSCAHFLVLSQWGLPKRTFGLDHTAGEGFFRLGAHAGAGAMRVSQGRAPGPAQWQGSHRGSPGTPKTTGSGLPVQRFHQSLQLPS